MKRDQQKYLHFHTKNLGTIIFLQPQPPIQLQSSWKFCGKDANQKSNMIWIITLQSLYTTKDSKT